MFSSYMITCQINQKRYIGITSKDVALRWLCHCYCVKHGSRCAIHRAIHKFGKEHFQIEKLKDYETWHDACEAEKALIVEYNTNIHDGNGYNMTVGGDGVVGYKYDETVRRKMSESHKKSLSAHRHRQNLHEARKVPVIQCTPDDEFIAEYPSIKDAIVATGIKTISMCCARRLKHSGGYKWHYAHTFQRSNV